MSIKKMWSLVLSMLLISNLTALVCFADDEVSISQAYVSTNQIDIFGKAEFDEESLNVKISNQVAEIVDCGTISEKGISVYTTILVDVSTSIPLETREKVIEFINHLIEKIPANEQYRIVAFGDQLITLQDFTNDRYDLSNGASKIEFNAQKTMIYDAIYNTLPKIQTIDGNSCYYRTVVVSDGVDVASSGITKEELYLKLQSETYPVDVIAVSKAKPDEPKKELSALTRISGGRYVDIYPEVDNASIADALDVGNMFWIRAEIHAALLDGSTRQVNISDGVNSMQFDIKVSVYDEPIDEIPSEDVVPEPMPVVTEDIATEGDNNEKSSDSWQSSSLMIIIGAILAVFVLVLIVLLIITNIKKASKKDDISKSTNRVPKSTPDSGNEKTEFMGESYTNADQFIIKLSSVKNTGNTWTLPIDKELLIGRSDSCAIRLDDKSVSREQCKIVINSSKVAVINLSQTNKTLLNRGSIEDLAFLNPGDTLKFGREVLRVDYIKALGEEVKPIEEEIPNGKNDTESLF